MFFEEFGVLADRPRQFLALLLIEVNGRSLFEVIVFLGRSWVLISGFSSVPRSLDVVPLHYYLLGVEDIGHNNEVASADLVTLVVLLDQLVQAEELGDESVGVLFEVVVVIFEDSP